MAAPQGFKECVGDVALVLQAGRQLHQQAAEALAQARHLRQHIVEQGVRAQQAQVVGDGAR